LEPLPSRRELLLVVLAFAALTTALLYPLTFHPGSLARVNNNDALFSIWNVAWVARTVVTDPLGVLDANIFYPHRWTLAYSEMNLGAGILAVPVYWVTRNPYAAHNAVLILSFVMSGVGMYLLARYLVGDIRAAMVAGIVFSFAPHLFAHLPHIQLLMTAFLPVGLLAFHRLADAPTPASGVKLGLALAVQAILCAYYVVFLVLMVGFAVLYMAAARGYWRSLQYWRAVLIAVATASMLVIPLFVPYLALQQEAGFARTLDASNLYSANVAAYLASAATAHSWMLPYLQQWFGRWNEVLFPGFVTVAGSIAGMVLGWRARGRLRETAMLYTALAVLAGWASFGPKAGLYTALYYTVPAFSLMRAPSRFGVVVLFALSVLTAIGVARVLSRRSAPWLAGAVLIVIAAAESYVPLTGNFFRRVPEVEGVYRILATLPDGAVLELPLFRGSIRFAQTRYMAASMAHWKPLVNAYSDYIPQDYLQNAPIYEDAPTAESLQLLKQRNVRYIVIHTDHYADERREALLRRIIEFGPHLRWLYADKRTLLFEVLSAPAPPAAPES
jgi:hypothetical protein